MSYSDVTFSSFATVHSERSAWRIKMQAICVMCMSENYLRLKPVGPRTNRTTRWVATLNQYLIWKVSFVGPCGFGGIIYRYELITQNMNWMAALRYCRSRSSSTHLVEIHNKDIRWRWLVISRVSAVRTNVCLPVCLSCFTNLSFRGITVTCTVSQKRAKATLKRYSSKL